MSSNSELTSVFGPPVATLQYPDIAGHPADGAPPIPTERRAGGRRRGDAGNEAEWAARIAEERSHAATQAEQKVRLEYQQKLLAERSAVTAAVAKFGEERNDYFARVELEIVQLALSIAAKILHREAQVDPMLVAALVRMAVEKMREGSAVTVRVSPGRVAGWKQYFAQHANMAGVQVAEDPQLTEQDCVLETDLGSANFGLDTQLKEVEQGFFDLLALRPTAR
jgi:flagellar assembly protein FliH